MLAARYRVRAATFKLLNNSCSTRCDARWLEPITRIGIGIRRGNFAIVQCVGYLPSCFFLVGFSSDDKRGDATRAAVSADNCRDASALSLARRIVGNCLELSHSVWHMRPMNSTSWRSGSALASVKLGRATKSAARCSNCRRGCDSDSSTRPTAW